MLNFNSPQYAQFYQWINYPENGLSTRFASTVFVFERGGDPGVSDRIIQFWSGSGIAVAELRGWLRELGEAATYKIDKATVKDLAIQRYRFIPRLMVAAGYAGWVILVDEVELIGRYSLRQRAKSYAEVARLLGKLEGADIPGLTAVLAITKSFNSRSLTSVMMRKRFSVDYALEGAAKSCYWPARLNEAYVSLGETAKSQTTALRTLTTLLAATSIKN